MEIVPYKAEHVLEMKPVFEQGLYQSLITPSIALSLEGPYAKTGIIDGQPIACAGVTPKWMEHWAAWAYLSADAGRHMLAVTRAIKASFSRLPRGRIETATPIDYKEGRHWLELLGFNCETPDGMAHYMPDGRVFALYSKVNLP